VAIYQEQPQGTRGLTEAQIDAIEETMRLLVEEDEERGVDLASEFRCPACRHSRSLAGSVVYDDNVRLCNGCATGYEVARAGHTVHSCEEYVRSRKLTMRFTRH
jgi:hypothetical protein